MTRVKIALVLVLAALGAVAARAQMLEPTPFPPMAKLRRLAGTYKGMVMQSSVDSIVPARLIWEVVSGGQAVLERLKMGETDEMVSVYYQEGDQMMMTHFCSSNTQPRLRTRAIPHDMKLMRFEFVDSTNILKANWMNISWLELQFPEPDAIVQVWQSHDPGAKAVIIKFHKTN